MSRLHRRAFLAGLGGALLASAACQPARYATREPPRGLALRINLLMYAPYAPLIVMQERALLQDRVPKLNVEWKLIPSADAVHDALRTGGLDVAIGSATTFLLLRDGGVPVRALAAVSELPIGVISNRPEVRRLQDLRPPDRIAVPGVGSHEASILRMAALREIGDPRALDGLLVGRSPGAGLSDLRTRQLVGAQAAISPFLDVGLETTGFRRLDDPVASPALTTILAYAMPDLYERRRPLYDAFIDALPEASTLAKALPGGLARLLNETEELDLSSPTLAGYLARPAVSYGTRLRGLSDLGRFLTLTGQLRSPAEPFDALAFPDVFGT